MRDNRGFAAIVPLLVIGGATLVIGGAIATKARLQTHASIAHAAREQALALAGACAEIGVGRLQSVFGYTGNEPVNANGITCDILPITGTGMKNRTVTARATVRGHTKTVTVIVSDISFPITISSWGE